MDLRAEFCIKHVASGMGIDWEDALELIRGFNDGLTQLEKDQRDRLIAAIDNLVDFAVAEEINMVNDIESIDEEDIDEESLTEEERRDAFHDECTGLCERYNKTYAGVENDDIEYSGLMAAMWITLAETTYLTYMTMGDERVRPWHLALEGETYPKNEFPSWMIPPIEHACRCFLVSSNDASACGPEDIMCKLKEPPSFVDGTFKDSLCKCGKIFSEEHPYFSKLGKYTDKYNAIRVKLKMKYYG